MIEIQVHPSDIRKKVRYYFFSSRQLKLMAMGAVGLMVFFVWAIIVAPQSYSHQVKKAKYRQEIKNQHALMNTVQVLIGCLKRDAGVLDANRQRLENLFYVFGVPLTSAGQGGVAFTPIPSRSFPRPGAPHLVRPRAGEAHPVRKNCWRSWRRARPSSAASPTRSPASAPSRPGAFVVTSAFGYRINPFTQKQDFHQGLDFSCPEGTPVWSAGDGVVTYAGRYPLSTSVSWWRVRQHRGRPA